MLQLPQLDVTKSEDGRWVTYFENKSGKIETLIARAGNKKARAMNLKMGQSHIRQIRRGDTEILEEINRKVMAFCIVRGWRGMAGDDGKEMQYTPELCLEIFDDPKYADYYEHCQQESGFDEEFRAEAMEEAAGNS